MYKSAITELLSRRVKLTELYGGTFVWGSNDAMKLDEGEYYRLCDIRKIDSPVNWDSVACGDSHTLAINSNGELYAWGNNEDGQLGIGSYTTQLSPHPVILVGDTIMRIKELACGYAHTVAIDFNGWLLAWGDNEFGQLGIGDYTTQPRYKRVGTATNWSSVACGESHTVAIKSNGELWAWGYNTYGQLGLGEGVGSQSTPQQVGIDTNWVSVACGQYQTLAINANGELWAWGSNAYGKLGIGTATMRYNTPQRVGTDTNWDSVACGEDHTLAINANGELWAWGWNDYGQLGLGHTTTKYTPQRVGTATNWVSVACGGNHTMAINSNREIWTCGLNTHGQLGTGDTVSKNILTLGWKNYDNWISLNVGANTDSSYAINSNGELWCYGSFANTVHTSTTIANTPIKKGNLELVKIASGNNFTIAAKADGTPVKWGANSLGQLGIGSTTTANTTHITDIYKKPIYALGYSHTLAINANGALWAWGNNGYGQLGIGNTTKQPTPQPVGTATNWVSVACGSSHTLAINAKGELWAWGDNQYGQLGIGNYTSQATPHRVGTATNWVSVACASLHTMAINASGRLWAWGYNSSSSLGLGTSIVQYNTPQPVGTDTNWVSVACGTFYTMAIKSNGELWAWGSNNYGQLGTGYTYNQPTPRCVGTDTNWVSVACGSTHTLAIKSNGELWAWGYNEYGQLGIGFAASQTTPQPVGTATNWVSVACGSSHTLAINANGELWAWGYNEYGQLGIGNTTNQYTPYHVGTDTNWSSVACGANHTMAVNASREIRVWGINSSGQLGIGNYTKQNIPYPIILVGNTIVRIKDLACGYAHTVAIDFNGWLWTWGYNDHGQLGLGNYTTQTDYKRVGTATNWVGVACGEAHTMAIKSNGELWAWGRNANWQLGLGPTQNITIYNIPMRVGTSVAWRKIAAGGYHSAAITASGALWTWGDNNYGQLGLGTTFGQYDTPQPVGTDTNWVSVACGKYHTMAINASGELWAWGSNANWQLGSGQNTDNVISPVRIAENNIWVRVICGAVNTVAIDILNHVYVCGDNTYGQLGLGAVSHQYYLVKLDNFSCTDISVGSNHMVAERVWSK